MLKANLNELPTTHIQRYNLKSRFMASLQTSDAVATPRGAAPCTLGCRTAGTRVGCTFPRSQCQPATGPPRKGCRATRPEACGPVLPRTGQAALGARPQVPSTSLRLGGESALERVRASGSWGPLPPSLGQLQPQTHRGPRSFTAALSAASYARSQTCSSSCVTATLQNPNTRSSKNASTSCQDAGCGKAQPAEYTLLSWRHAHRRQGDPEVSVVPTERVTKIHR